MPTEEFSKLTKMFIGRRKSSFITRKFLGKPKIGFSVCGIIFLCPLSVFVRRENIFLSVKSFFGHRKIEVAGNDKAPMGIGLERQSLL